MRIIPLVLSVALTLAACSQTVQPPSGNDSEELPPAVEPAPGDQPSPIAPPEVPEEPSPTPPPPGDQPPVDEPDEPVESPEPPPTEEPAPPVDEPADPVEPPAEEPPSAQPPAQPEPPVAAPPPVQPAPQPPVAAPPPTQPEPVNIDVTRTAGGAAPWTVAYDWTTPDGYEVTYKCDGFDHSAAHLKRVDCHHTAAGQGLTLTITSPDGDKTTQRVDGRVTASAVPYAGEWYTYGPYGEVRFTISEKGAGTSGISADGQHFISLNSNGTLSVGLYGATVTNLFAGEPFGQSGELTDNGAWEEEMGEPLWGHISRGP